MADKKHKMNLVKVKQALAVINHAQQKVWELHNEVRKHDDVLGEQLWALTLQIEHALLKLNEEVLGGKGYFENEQEK